MDHNKYELAQLQIKEDGENLADEEMTEVYKKHEQEENNINKFISSLFIGYAAQGIISNLRKSEKRKINNNIEDKLITIGDKLGKHEVNKVTDILKDGYNSTYYKNEFLIYGGFKINYNMQKKEYIESVIKQEFKSDMYSNRIWINKGKMINELQKELDLILKGQSTIDISSRKIRKIFDVTAYESDRLMRTELARCQAQAQVDVALNEDFSELIWSSTLERNTCSTCAGLDGTIWKTNDSNKPEQPQHPLCRCSWILMTDSLKILNRKDNETKELIDNTNYINWAKSKGIL